MYSQPTSSIDSQRRTAFGDESIVQVSSPVARVYILASTSIENSEIPAARAAIARLSKSRTKLHWHTESALSRSRICLEMAGLPFSGLAIAHIAHLSVTPERQRRLCLIELFESLPQSDTDRLYLESRGKKLDDRDRRLITDVWSARRYRLPVSLGHKPGFAEPLLWLADFVCGSLGHAYRGDDADWKHFENKVRLRVINSLSSAPLDQEHVNEHPETTFARPQSRVIRATIASRRSNSRYNHTSDTVMPKAARQASRRGAP